jgi:uncharacterized DUF497 family protein
MLRIGPWLYTWDEEKRRRVRRKHGYDFAAVAEAMQGPVFVDFDEDHSDEEERLFALVEIANRVVRVVFTERGRERRLVTAFAASEEETVVFYRRLFAEKD